MKMFWCTQTAGYIRACVFWKTSLQLSSYIPISELVQSFVPGERSHILLYVAIAPGYRVSFLKLFCAFCELVAVEVPPVLER